MTEHGSAERARTAEIIAACCLATDLGMGFPFEHGLQATSIAMNLADALGVDSETAAKTYYASLLMYSGCTTDADISTRIFLSGQTENITPVQFGSPREMMSGVMRALPDPGSPPHRRPFEIAKRLPPAGRFLKPHFASLCEVASMLAVRLGLPPDISDLFIHLTERWDGHGLLGRAKGEEIPLPIRIVHVARDAAYQRHIGGEEHAIEAIRHRTGHAFDPQVADLFVSRAKDLLTDDGSGAAWDAVLAQEPRPWLTLEGERVDRALTALGNFADLASPFLSGHSTGVADLAGRAARICGLDESQVRLVRRAGLVHDLGRVAVHPSIWYKAGRLTADEWEQVRLHGYHTERVLHLSPLLASLAEVACAHHERLDGSGYHRNARAISLTLDARLLAAADCYHAMRETRSHRPALEVDAATRIMEAEVKAGRLDADSVAAVLEGAGQPRPQLERPGGLTPREAEVVAFLARGLQTKQVAKQLEISPKTADRHIQNAYQKMGVSTRAAATLFAMEHGLVSWGELPIHGENVAP